MTACSGGIGGTNLGEDRTGILLEAGKEGWETGYPQW